MNRYVFDKKLNKSWIESDEMKCSKCKKEFKNDDWVYLGIRTKRIRCDKCAIKSTGAADDIFNGDIEWRPGNIRGITKNED